MRNPRPPRPPKRKTDRTSRRPQRGAATPPDAPEIQEVPRSRYDATRFQRPPEGSVTQVAEQVAEQDAPVARAAEDTMPNGAVPEGDVPAADVDPELAKLRDENARLERNNTTLREKLDRAELSMRQFQCPPGYTVSDSVSEAPSSMGRDSEGNPSAATIHQVVAKNQEHDWQVTQIDHETAVRSCWNHALEVVTKERDELQRRWDQRKATEESKKRAKRAASDEDTQDMTEEAP